MNPSREQWRFRVLKGIRRPVLVSVLSALPIATFGCSSESASSSTDQRTVSADPKPESEPSRRDRTNSKLAEAEASFLAMSNPDPEAWEAAYQRLQEIGAPALPVLLKALTSDAPDQRVNASSVLAAFGAEAESAAQELIAALDDESMFVRANVATALLQMPDHIVHAIPVFAEILISDNAELRPSAAMNLASIETEKVRPFVPQLIVALDDPDRRVVLQITQSLGRIGPAASDALAKLRELRPEADEELQAAIASAISLIDPGHQVE